MDREEFFERLSERVGRLMLRPHDEDFESWLFRDPPPKEDYSQDELEAREVAVLRALATLRTVRGLMVPSPDMEADDFNAIVGLIELAEETIMALYGDCVAVRKGSESKSMLGYL